MKRLVVGLVLGAAIFGAGFAGAKVVTVTNPMTASLDGGGNNIEHVNLYAGNDTDLGAVHAREGFYSGSVLLGLESTPYYPGHLALANGSGDGRFVEVTAGVGVPTGGTPGIYLQDRGGGAVALWIKTGAGWTCVAGCGP